MTKKTLSNLLGLALIAAIGYIGLRSIGPSVEMYFKAPVNSLEFDAFVCDGRDVVVSGVLNKEAYGDGEAQFVGLTLLSEGIPRERLAWENVDQQDRSPESRPAGTQMVDIRVTKGCNVPFKAYTRHISPITGFVLPMSFGPFNK